MKVGLLIGNGYVPGLNAVIYGILLKASESGIMCIGIKNGWRGFIKNIKEPLDVANLDKLHKIGGSLISTSNYNPYKILLKNENSKKFDILQKRIASEIVSKFKDLDIDALIVIGDNDTLILASALHKYSHANIIGVPITIDNNLYDADFTLGFWSITQLISNTLDNLKTTARSYQRIFIVEIAGKSSGLLTLFGGISSGADIIIIPEIKFDLKRDVINIIKERVRSGYKSHIITCSEGSCPTIKSIKRDFKTIPKEIIIKISKNKFNNSSFVLSNISQILVNELNLRDDLKEVFRENGLDFECKKIVLNHIIKGGTPNAFDRILGLRLGIEAINLILMGEFGKIVSLQENEIKVIPFSEVIKRECITPKNDLIELKDLMLKTNTRR